MMINATESIFTEHADDGRLAKDNWELMGTASITTLHNE